MAYNNSKTHKAAHAWLLIATLLLTVACKSKHQGVPLYTKDFCSQVHFGKADGLSVGLQPLADSMAHKTGVYVLEDGEGAMIARAYLCEQAEHTIDIQYFIFSTDNVGLIACDYLVRAAERGVKVRILVDDIMVDATPHEILTLGSHKNISIKIYNPGTNLGKNIAGKLIKLVTDFKGANQRMHNKTFTVDGTVAITGGRNIADEYFDYSHEFNFRDRDVLLIGPTVKNINQSFEDFWNSPLSVPVQDLVQEPGLDTIAPKQFESLHQYACDPENFWPQVRTRIEQLPEAFKKIQQSGDLVWTDSVTFISDIPGKNHSNGMHGGGNTTDKLTGLVNAAQHTIDIQTPYLIVTDEALELLRKTIKRGVQIRILTNSLASNDNLQSFGGYQKVRKKLLEAGVKIYEFKPDAKERYITMTSALQHKINFTPVFGLHAKCMVVDGYTTVIGTFNMDPRSANLNSECITIISSAKIAAGVLKGIEQEYLPENSWQTTLSFNPDDQASATRRVKTFGLKVVPKKIL